MADREKWKKKVMCANCHHEHDPDSCHICECSVFLPGRVELAVGHNWDAPKNHILMANCGCQIKDAEWVARCQEHLHSTDMASLLWNQILAMGEQLDSILSLHKYDLDSLRYIY